MTTNYATGRGTGRNQQEKSSKASRQRMSPLPICNKVSRSFYLLLCYLSCILILVTLPSVHLFILRSYELLSRNRKTSGYSTKDSGWNPWQSPITQNNQSGFTSSWFQQCYDYISHSNAKFSQRMGAFNRQYQRRLLVLSAVERKSTASRCSSDILILVCWTNSAKVSWFEAYQIWNNKIGAKSKIPV